MEIIYSIQNLINGKRYIGRTCRGFDHRYYKGQWWKYSCSPSLRAAAKKYGRENFEVTTIWRGESKAECIEKEVELIRSHRSLYPNGYNHTDSFGGGHLRHPSVLNNNTSWIYTLLHLGSGEILCSDNLETIASHIGYSVVHVAKHRNELGRTWGQWKLVEIRHKPIVWHQKHILFNVETGKWAYDTYEKLYEMLKEGKCNAPALSRLIAGERKRVGPWVLYKNRQTWQKRKPKCSLRSYDLIGPQGDRVHISHMPQFCRERGLDYQSMMKMVGGRRETYCGWRRGDSKIRNRRINRITVHTPTGPIACRTTEEARAAAGCSIGTLYRMIDGEECQSFPGVRVNVEYAWAA